MKKIMKRIASCLCVLTILLMLPIEAKADTGPKPSVNVTIKGITSENYYATLLSETESTGPASAYDGTNYEGTSAYYNEIPNAEELWQKFQDYKDVDGYYFLQWIWDAGTNNSFVWGYYPPQKFKILLYFPQFDSYVVSEVQERYAFDSFYTVDLTGVDYKEGGIVELVEKENVQKTYNYRDELISFLARVLITIAVEVFLAVLFQLYGRKQLLFIGLVNIITQIILNVLLNYAAYIGGAKRFVLCYFLLELLVTVIEAILYVRFMPENKKAVNAIPSNGRVIIYAIVANIASYGTGFYIAKVLPGIF